MDPNAKDGQPLSTSSTGYTVFLNDKTHLLQAALHGGEVRVREAGRRVGVRRQRGLVGPGHLQQQLRLQLKKTSLKKTQQQPKNGLDFCFKSAVATRGLNGPRDGDERLLRACVRALLLSVCACAPVCVRACVRL